jgi:hypothetical protein
LWWQNLMVVMEEFNANRVNIGKRKKCLEVDEKNT